MEPTEQQQAVIAHDWTQHARVLAGPGTGKSVTAVALAQRLRTEDENLRLRFLTFTRAATAELARKLLDAPVTEQDVYIAAHPGDREELVARVVASSLDRVTQQETVAAVRDLFERAPDRTWTNAQVLAALVGRGLRTDRASVNAALADLAWRGEIRRIRRGRYARARGPARPEQR